MPRWLAKVQTLSSIEVYYYFKDESRRAPLPEASVRFLIGTLVNNIGFDLTLGLRDLLCTLHRLLVHRLETVAHVM